VRVYAFIDAQNLYLGIKSQGWELDYKKLFIYLKEKYKVDKTFLYIGYIAENMKLYKSLKNYGYELVFKKTKKFGQGNKDIKGNIDVDLTVDVIRREEEYKKAIFISADGDFCPLYDYLIEEKNKEILIMIPNSFRYSNFLLKYRKNLRYMNNLENKLKR